MAPKFRRKVRHEMRKRHLFLQPIPGSNYSSYKLRFHVKLLWDGYRFRYKHVECVLSSGAESDVSF
jgi:hypothetical protein